MFSPVFVDFAIIAPQFLTLIYAAYDDPSSALSQCSILSAMSLANQRSALTRVFSRVNKNIIDCHEQNYFQAYPICV